MNLDKVYNISFQEGIKQIPDKSIDLIIADPPYFEIKGEFDFVLSWEEWLEMHAELAKEAARVLSPRGSIFLYGHALNIAYQQIIFDHFFKLENNLTWEIIEARTRKGAYNYRKFAPVTERILFYSNEKRYPAPSGWEKVKHDPNNFKALRAYFKASLEELGLSKRKLIERVGQGADHCFRSSSPQWSLPTEKTYKALAELGLSAWAGFKSLEALQIEFSREREELEAQILENEDQRRKFDNYTGQTDVIRLPRDCSAFSVYDHDTVKPEKLTELLIQTTTRPGERVLIPFAGSGTEAAACERMGRKWIAFEINSKHVNTTRSRIFEERKTPRLFYQ